ncbi:MAG: VWA domain-containing protein [Candidatus Thiodiazotropha sp.]
MGKGKPFAKLLTLTLLLCAAALQAAPAERADVRVLIDVSGSMKHNDPQNLRRPALRLLVGLLPPQTRAGVWTFGQYVNMQIPLGEADRAWKAKARRSSKSIGSPGQFTNIEEALKRATEDWSGASPGGYARSVILLTDGMVDISRDKTKNAASRQRILQTLLPRLASEGAVVHTIALSKHADHVLMRQLAETTGGWYEQVENADQLQKVFLRLFEKVGKPDSVPLKDNRFSIDSSITEATVLVFHKADAQPTEVIPPDGKAFGAENTPSNVQWHRDQGYDMLTVSDPAAGEWRIRAETDPDNRVMVVTDLKMQTTELPNRLVQGQVVPFEASFTDHGKLIRKQEFLHVVEVSATQSDSAGAQEPQPLLDDGSDGDETANDGHFSMRFGGESLRGGLGELVVDAKGATFVRQKRLTFEVVPPVKLQVTPREGSELLDVSLNPDATLIEPQSLQAKVWLEDADGKRTSLELTKSDANFRSEIDLAAFSGSRKVVVEAGATDLAGKPLDYADDSLEIEGLKVTPSPAPAPEPEVKPPPAPAQPAPPPAEPVAESGWMGSTLWLVLINLLLLLLAGGAFWWLRMRKLRSLVVLVDEETSEAEPPEKAEDAA